MTHTLIPPKRQSGASRDVGEFLFTNRYRLIGLYEIARSMVRHLRRSVRGLSW